MPFDFDAVAAPFRMQPGLRRIPAGTPQLTPNEPGSPHLAAKLDVLRRHPSQALLAEPQFDASAAIGGLTAQALLDHPQAVCRDADGGVCARRLGWSVRGDEVRGAGPPAIGECLGALPGPWRRVGLLCLAFAEDVALIDAATTRIPWLAVCLPSHWSPQDKLGRGFAEVHGPVPDSARLIAASEHLARLVSGSERWERFVWSVTSRSALDAHPDRSGPAVWPSQADADADELARFAFFRTEHQTFIPLPVALGQALFTIHVEVRPLADAIASPERARRLHDALASMSAAVLDYRGLTDARGRLLDWLDRRAR